MRLFYPFRSRPAAISAAVAALFAASVRADTTLSGAQSVSTNTTNPAGNTAHFVDTGTAADGNFVFSNNAIYTNAGTFSAENDRAFTGTGTFSNTGTFIKTGTVGVTEFDVPFSNAGAVTVSTGTLSLTSAVTGTGSYTVAAPATLNFFSPSTAGALTNNGTVNVSTGNSTFTSVAGTGSLSLYAGSSTFTTGSLNQQALSINSTSLAFTAGGANAVTTLTAINSYLYGAAADGTTVPTNPTVLNVGASATLGNVQLYRGMVLNLNGSSVDSGDNIAGDSNTVLNVNAGASLTNPGTRTLYISIPANNNGTISSTGGGDVELSVAGTHNGTFNVSAGSNMTASGTFNTPSVVNDSGNFTITGGSASTTFNGTMNVAPNATLTLGGRGPVTFGPSAAFSFGAGSTLTEYLGGATFTGSQNLNIPNVVLPGGGVTFSNGGLSVQTLTVGTGSASDSGTILLETASNITVGTFNLQGGMCTVNTGADTGHSTVVTVNTLNFSAGSLRGIYNVTGSMTWSGGVIDGAAVGTTSYGIVTIEPGATYIPLGGNLYRGGVLNNLGNLVAPHGYTVGVSDGTSSSDVLNLQLQSQSTVTGALNAGNDGSRTTGTGHGVINVTDNAILNVNGAINLGSTVGGSGQFNQSGHGTTSAREITMNDANISGGTFTITADPNSTDTEGNGAIIGGYQRDGQFNVSGTAVVTAPFLKLGVTAGNTGTYNQSGGSTTYTTMAIGSDTSSTTGSGIGVATNSGGTDNTAAAFVGSSAGGVGTWTVNGSGVANVGGNFVVSSGSHVTVTGGGTLTLNAAGGNPAAVARPFGNPTALLLVNGGTNQILGGGTVTADNVQFVADGSPNMQLTSDANTPGKLVLTAGGNILVTGTGAASLSSAGTATLPGVLDLSGSASHVVSVGYGTTFTVTAAVTDGGMEVSGAGMLKLMGADTMTGGITVDSGTTLYAGTPTALGAAGSTVTLNGGTLDLRSDSAATFPYSVSPASATSSTAIDIDRLTTGATPTPTITINGLSVGSDNAAFTVTGSDGGTLAAGGVTLLYNAAAPGPAYLHTVANLTIGGAVTASGGSVDLYKDSAGTLTLAGSTANSFGSFTVAGGTVLLNKTGAVAVPGNLTISNAATVRLMQSGQIATTAAVTLNAGCLLDLNGYSDTLGPLTFSAGGTLSTGTGVAILGGNVTTTGAAGTATIAGNLNLGAAARTFTVARGSAAADLLVTATVTGNYGLTKAGPGILDLAGTVTANGPLTVSAGDLKLDAPVLSVSTLTMAAGSVLDLNNRALDLRSATLAFIQAQLRQGLITSSAAAANPTHLTALGVIQNNQAGRPSTPPPTVRRLAAGAADVLVKYTYYGDANLDGQVDGSDYTLIDNGYNQHLTGWYNGDFNYDGVVDGSDYTLIDNAFNTQTGTSSPAGLFADVDGPVRELRRPRTRDARGRSPSLAVLVRRKPARPR